jgi:hypothetical protein
MSLIAAAIALGQPAPAVKVKAAFLTDPEADKVVIQAWIPAPEGMTAREAAAWRVLGLALREEAQKRRVSTLGRMSLEVGEPPRVEVLPDLMFLQLAARPENRAAAMDGMATLIGSVAFRDEDLQALIDSKPTFPEGRFGPLLAGMEWPQDRLRPNQVTNLYQHAFRPEAAAFGIAGKVDPIAAVSDLERSFARSLSRRPERALRFDLPWLRAATIPGQANAYEIRSAPFLPSAPDAAAKILAVFALGAGKSSTLFRTLRREEGLSYSQEALLLPTQQGWQARLIMLRTPTEDDIPILQKMEAKIRADVESWSAETRIRAYRLAEAALDRQAGSQVIWLSASGPMGATLSERSAFFSYQRMLWADAPRPDELLRALGGVAPEQMKAAALQMLESAGSGIIPAG